MLHGGVEKLTSAAPVCVSEVAGFRGAGRRMQGGLHGGGVECWRHCAHGGLGSG